MACISEADKRRVARSQREDAGRITRSRMARPHEDGASVNIQNVMEGLPDLKEKMLVVSQMPKWPGHRVLVLV
eukprot:gene13000-14339_t